MNSSFPLAPYDATRDLLCKINTTTESFIEWGCSASPTALTCVGIMATCSGAHQIFPISLLSIPCTAVTLIALKTLHSMTTQHYSRLYHEWSLIGLKLVTICKPNHLDWWNTINDKIILGALPLTLDHCNQIKQKAHAILSIVEPFELKGVGLLSDPVTEENWKEAGLEQKQLSVIDGAAPTIEQIKEGVEFIYDQADKNHKVVYVHCKAGRGRSATLVICYLIKYKKSSFERALQEVETKRPVVKLKRCQIEIAKAFEKTM